MEVTANNTIDETNVWGGGNKTSKSELWETDDVVFHRF